MSAHISKARAATLILDRLANEFVIKPSNLRGIALDNSSEVIQAIRDDVQYVIHKVAKNRTPGCLSKHLSTACVEVDNLENHFPGSPELHGGMTIVAYVCERAGELTSVFQGKEMDALKAQTTDSLFRFVLKQLLIDRSLLITTDPTTGEVIKTDLSNEEVVLEATRFAVADLVATLSEKDGPHQMAARLARASEFAESLARGHGFVPEYSGIATILSSIATEAMLQPDDFPGKEILHPHLTRVRDTFRQTIAPKLAIVPAN